MEIIIREMVADDWRSVEEIYKQGIETGNATFQHDTPTWAEWDKGHLQICRFVAVLDNEIIGWAALSPVSSRCVYGGVAEVSIYISNKARGQKIGTSLLDYLIEESEKNNFWTLQSGIFPENRASIRLHESLGFRMIGYREKIGCMNGVWRDTVLMERRSTKVGID